MIELQKFIGQDIEVTMRYINGTPIIERGVLKAINPFSPTQKDLVLMTETQKIFIRGYFNIRKGVMTKMNKEKENLYNQELAKFLKKDVEVVTIIDEKEFIQSGKLLEMNMTDKSIIIENEEGKSMIKIYQLIRRKRE